MQNQKTKMRAAAVSAIGLGIFPLFICSLQIVSAFPMPKVDVDGRQFSPGAAAVQLAESVAASPDADVEAETRQVGSNPSIKALTAGFRFRDGTAPHPNSIDSRKEQLLDDSEDQVLIQVQDEPDSPSPPTLQSTTIKLINSEDTKNQENLQSSTVKNLTNTDAKKPIIEAQLPEVTEAAEEQVAASTQNSQAKMEFLHRLQMPGILIPEAPNANKPTAAEQSESRDDSDADPGLVKIPPPFTPEIRQSVESISPFFNAYSFNSYAPLSILSEFHRGNYFTI